MARVSADEVKPLMVQQKGLEAVGHEFFTPSGRVGAQYSYRYKPDMPFFLFADLYICLLYTSILYDFIVKRNSGMGSIGADFD